MPQDSTGKDIGVGDRVRFRGQVYTIKTFTPGGRLGTRRIVFDEPQHTPEPADEISVDRVCPAPAAPPRPQDASGSDTMSA